MFSKGGTIKGPLGFAEGIVVGTEHLIGSAVGSVAGVGSRLTNVISKGLATLTFDENYVNIRTQRKKSRKQTTSDIVNEGKSVAKVF